MKNVRLLLAGPGTGKTTSIKRLIGEKKPQNILVLSFTNATIRDLVESFDGANLGVDGKNCMTLHGYALQINPLSGYEVLDNEEELILERAATKMGVPFEFLCQALKCVTFAGMIGACTKFLSTNQVYAKERVGELDLLVVDEFQDFNERERALLYKLFDHAKEVIILGDDDQAIYDFKDADSAELIALHSSSEIEKIPHENICYRCPDDVVEAATNLIAHNKTRVDKPWGKSGRAGSYRQEQLRTQQDTIAYITSEVHKIKAGDADPSKPASIMVLAPVGFAIEGLPEALAADSITYTNWFENKIEKELLHLIRTLRAVYGDNPLLHLLILSKGELKGHLSKEARLFHLVAKHLQAEFDPKQALAEVLGANIYSDEMTALMTKPPILNELLATAGFELLRPYFEDEDVSEEQIKTILSRLPTLVKRDLVKPEPGAVDIMSIHRSKGLQANHVFMVGLVNGILPNQAKGIATLEAQRRQVYVGMTRAKTALHMLSTLEWEGKYANRVDKPQFKYDRRTGRWAGTTSDYVAETLGQ